MLILAAMMVAIGPLKAQQFQMPQQQQAVKDYSEKEIDDFVGTVAKVLPVQQEGEMKMVEKIEESGMELEAFNQVATQLQSGQADGISESDMAKLLWTKFREAGRLSSKEKLCLKLASPMLVFSWVAVETI